MPKIITDPDSGEEVEMFTPDELEAERKRLEEEFNGKLAEKDAHVQKKLDEFKQGKTASQLEKEDNDRRLAEAEDTAKKAQDTANSIITQNRTRVINFFAEQFVGEDAEMRKTLDSAFATIEAGRKAQGLDVTSEEAIKEMIVAASNMSGLGSNQGSISNLPLNGGMPPRFSKSEDEVDEADHQKFLKETGYISPKPAGDEGAKQ